MNPEWSDITPSQLYKDLKRHRLIEERNGLPVLVLDLKRLLSAVESSREQEERSVTESDRISTPEMGNESKRIIRTDRVIKKTGRK